MTDSNKVRLRRLSEAVSDGSSVDWDAECRDTPNLSSELKRLQQLEAIGRVHLSITPSGRPMGGEAAPPGDQPEGSPRPCPFDWGPLRAVEHVGRGSFGDVYRAVEPRLQREVALKLRRIEATRTDASARRFLDEARSLARIRHPNVVVVHGADVQGGRVGFWTDFVRGRTLAAHLSEKGILGAEEAAAVGLDLCRALGAVHAAGLVHGDVKPTNAMREENGRVLLMDFGAASWLPSEERTDRSAGALIGSPLTMAPEVLAGEAPQAASDLYSLGVLLHQLVTGRYPYVGRSVSELRQRQEGGERTPLGELRPDLPPAWVEVVERALNRDLTLRYQSAAEMERALLAAMGGPAARRHSLPAEPDALIGREGELVELTQRFDGGARLVTLLGTAGLGKTRLAVRWGWQSLETWPGGVWFCDLTEAKTLDGIVSAVGGAFEVPLGKDDAVEQLGHVLAGRRRCLVILDNFEQVVELGGRTVGRWLDQAPEARFLITSRERLNVRGESVQVVEPLSLESGVALFIEKARGQGPSFELDGPMAKPIRELVDLLEGIPLAIELAAARTRVMTPAQMLMRMRDRFRVLSGGAGGGGRHSTLRAAIDGSWELLRSWERAAFAQCSVFQGGFTLEAAEGVLDLSAWPDAPWMVDVVQSLVDKRLLRTLPADGSGAASAPVRVGMFASLQEYARAKLQEEAVESGGSGAGAMRAAEERHGRWYARYGTAHAIEALYQRGGVERLRALGWELENLITACRRALARGDGETATAAYGAIWAVLDLRGPFGVAVELGREVLACALGHEERAIALTALGGAERRSGRMQEACVHFEAALVLHREVGDRRGEGSVLSSLGVLHFEQGLMDEGRADLETALAIHREVGNRRGEGIVLGNLGNLHRAQGRMEEARAHFKAALALHRKEGDRLLEGRVLGNLANLDADEGRMEEARTHYEEALAIRREVGDRRGEGIVVGNLGILHTVQGRMEEARTHYEEALAIHREVGDRFSEGNSLNNLGNLHRLEGRMEEARTHYEAAVAINRETGNRRGEGSALGSLGNLYADEGRMEEALEALAEGEALLRALNDRNELAKLLCIRAELEHRGGDTAAARSITDEAEALAAQIGAGNDSELGRRLAKLRQALAPESGRDSGQGR